MLGHEWGNIVTDFAFFRLNWSGTKLEQRSIVLHDCVDFGDVEKRPTVDPWHMRINFNDEFLGEPSDCTGVVVVCAECEISVSIHRRHSDEECVDGNLVSEKSDRLAERAGDVVDDLSVTVLHPLLDQLAFGLLEEHAIWLDSAHKLVT